MWKLILVTPANGLHLYYEMKNRNIYCLLKYFKFRKEEFNFCRVMHIGINEIYAIGRK